jgi:hypothetical protein
MAERVSVPREISSVPTRGAFDADWAASREPFRAHIAKGRAALLQRVNEVMREGREGRTEPELIPFFCECGRADCDEPLLLTADAYDERRADPEDSLTLPGHAPSSAPRQWLQDDP